MAKKNYYVDRNNPAAGVYVGWDVCQKEKEKGKTNFYGFVTREEAEAFLKDILGASPDKNGASNKGGASNGEVLEKGGPDFRQNKTVAQSSFLYSNSGIMGGDGINLTNGCYIGSDEVGKIEPLKQLIVVSVYVDPSHFEKMASLGVGDSKHNTDAKKVQVGLTLTGFEEYDDVTSGFYENAEYGLSYYIEIMTNREYNLRVEELIKAGLKTQANVILSEQHNKANIKLYEKLFERGVDISAVVIDDFMNGYYRKFGENLSHYDGKKLLDVEGLSCVFETKAEDKYPEIVGTASMIADYIDGLWQEKLNKKYGMTMDYGNNIKMLSLRKSFEAVRDLYPDDLSNIKHTKTYHDWLVN